MKRARHVLAVALVATALCADRAVAAAPTNTRSHSAESVARRIVTQLSVRLRRVVPSVRLWQSRQDGIVADVVAIAPTVEPAAQMRPALRLSPFYLFLPPPVL